MSYSRRDEAVMRRVTGFLRKQGINVWVDNEKLVPGTPIWEEEIEKAIIGSGAVVVLLSPDAKKSEWVRREISYAEDNGKRIFPILVAGDERNAVPIRLTNHQRVDIRQSQEVGLNALKAALSSYFEECAVQEQRTREKAEQEIAEKAAKEKAEGNETEKTEKEREQPEEQEQRKSEEKPNSPKTSTNQRTPFLFSWLGRVSSGIIFGVIVAFFVNLATPADNPPLIIGIFPILMIVCGLSGLFIYPHEKAQYYLMLGFFLTGITTATIIQAQIANGYFLASFLAFGTFGFLIGAIISRILHWFKII